MNVYVNLWEGRREKRELYITTSKWIYPVVEYCCCDFQKESSFQFVLSVYAFYGFCEESFNWFTLFSFNTRFESHEDHPGVGSSLCEWESFRKWDFHEPSLLQPVLSGETMILWHYYTLLYILYLLMRITCTWDARISKKVSLTAASLISFDCKLLQPLSTFFHILIHEGGIICFIFTSTCFFRSSCTLLPFHAPSEVFFSNQRFSNNNQKKEGQLKSYDICLPI